jgi:hypothetical protein
VPEDATRRKLLPNAAVIEDDDDDDAGTEPELLLMEDDDVEEVEWSEDRCGVGIEGAVVTAGAAAAGDAVGRRMRRGDLEGAEPKKVRAPAAPSLMMGDWRA